MVALTPAVAEQLAESVAAGVPIDTAADYLGVGRQTVYDWLRLARTGETVWSSGTPVSEQSLETISYLSDLLQRARAEFEANSLRQIREWRNRHGEDDWRQHAWVLEHHPAYRGRYGKLVIQQHSGTVNHQVLEHLSDAELEQLAALPDPTNAPINQD